MKFSESNSLFTCDALTLLERLPSASVTLTYLNPPWGMGHRFGNDIESQAADSIDHYSDYLSKIAQQIFRVLDQQGSLFVHWGPISPIDIRLVINQVFGGLPRSEITWPRKTINQHNRFSVDHDTILVYAKSDDTINNPIFRPFSRDEHALYASKDEHGPYKLEGLTTPLNRQTMQFEWQGFRPPPGKSWRFSKERLDALYAGGRIQFTQSRGTEPRLKRYLAEHPGKKIGSHWEDISSIIPSHENTRYLGQTPLALMERIVKLASNEGDRVLDPFCGTGTTLIAAQLLGRRWLGADSSDVATEIAVQRLRSECGLTAGKGFASGDEYDLAPHRAEATSYKPVIVNVEEIEHLQTEVTKLVDSIFSLKRQLRIDDGDKEERVEDAIQKMEQWISDSMPNASDSLDGYVKQVRFWLDGWEKLDSASQLFLPQAELLFETIERCECGDYSPFILQYCRALENELLTKLFAAYTVDLYRRLEDVSEFLCDDLKAKGSTYQFAAALAKRSNAYTLGTMTFVMGLMKNGGRTLGISKLLQDFRGFTTCYFGDHIVDEVYLNQINEINMDFRCKAAHPYILEIDVARRCREAVRKCLNDLILNYQG